MALDYGIDDTCAACRGPKPHKQERVLGEAALEASNLLAVAEVGDYRTRRTWEGATSGSCNVDESQAQFLEAVQLLHVALHEEPNDPCVMCNLGACYESGKGVKQDLLRASKLYEAAAERGSATAQCNLGV